MQAALDLPLLAMPSPGEESELAFQWAALSALAQAETARAPSTLQHALRCWSALDQGQQERWENFYFLLAALTEHQLGADAAPAGWRTAWASHSAKSRGHCPVWMSDVAQRLGFTV